jgi:hypothetical protein
MEKPIYRFYLRAKNGASFNWYYANNSSVTFITQTLPTNALQYAPLGWQDITISWERGFTYHGVITNYTEPLKFIRDSAKILRTFYYNSGCNAALQLYVEKFNNSVSVNDYELFFIGDIDFSTIQDEKDTVTATIIEGGFMANFKARENTDYEFDIVSDANIKKVLVDGFTQQVKVNWTTKNQIVLGTGRQFTGQYFNNNTVPPFAAIITKDGFNNGDLEFYDVDTGEGISVGGDKFIIGIGGASVGSPYLGNINNTTAILVKNVSLINSHKIDLSLKFDLGYANDDTIASGVKIQINTVNITTGNYTNINDIFTSTSVAASSAQIFSINQTSTFNIPPNSFIVLVVKDKNSISTSAWRMSINIGDITIIGYNSCKPTFVKCFSPKYVFDKLVDKIGDSLTVSSSSLLVNNADILMTSGNSLRKLPTAKIKTNISDFYKSWNAILGAAMYYDGAANRVYLESKSSVYNQSLSLSLGTVAKMTIKPLTSEMFSKLKAGYPSVSYDAINGKDEYNKQHEWLTPHIRVQSEKDLTSIYRADCYGIEQVRSEFLTRDTADSVDNTDNDIYLLHADLSTPYTDAVEGTYYKLKRYSGMTISNILNTDLAYNINITPKRNLLRHSNYLSSVLHNITGIITHVGTNKLSNQPELETIFSSVTINEGTDITISTLSAPLFLPITFEIETQEPINIYSVLNQYPYKHLSFVYNGNTYYGFIIKAQHKPSQSQTQQFTLLCSPTTNINNLIH